MLRFSCCMSQAPYLSGHHGLWRLTTGRRPCKITEIVLAGTAALTISSAALAQQALTGTITKIDRINGTVEI